MKVWCLVLLGCLFRIIEEAVSEESGSGLQCLDGEFQCLSSGLCIAEHLVCNARPDCPQGEDESVCPSQTDCHIDEFRCSSRDKCVSLKKMCDGISDCSDGSDEESCDDAPSGSVCASNQFPCAIRGPCIPLAFLCNGVGDCPNGDDESRCEQSDVEVQMPKEITVRSGANFTLSCEAFGYPPPFVSWRRNLQPLHQDSRYNFTSRNGFGVLRVRSARLEDAGKYHCQVTSTLHGSRLVKPSVQVIVQDASPLKCLDSTNLTYPEGSYYYDVQPVGVGPASQAAADIVFVVDESASMVREHNWIREEVGIIDRILKTRGVGAGERNNLFALVGFGRNDPQAIAGISLTHLTSASDFVEASRNLMLSGTFEDGYAAIDYSLENIVTRPDTAKQLILVTDEDRSVLRPDLSREVIESRLRRTGFVLNVVVNQALQLSPFGSGSFILGVTNKSAYLFDPFSKNLFSVSDISDGVNPSSEFSFGSTFEDYVELALKMSGAAWDLNQLREEGQFARAFTNAFTEVKVEEVMTVFRYCFECLCMSFREVCSLASGVSLKECRGTFPVVRSAVTPRSTLIKSGTTVSFECLSYTNFKNLTLSYRWMYPPELGGAVTIDNEVLMVGNADSAAEVNYTCIVSLEGTALTSTATATLSIDTRCRLQDQSYLVLGDMKLISAPRADNLSRAVDVILLVDESSSMAEEHSWIPTMTQQLDQALMDINIGNEQRNRFGVVGFGDDCDDQNALGRVLLNSMQQGFGVADNITDFTRNLNLGGRSEDGYGAIHIALDNYTFRDVAKQFILITDEDRDALNQNLTRETIRSMLEDNEVLLNAVISEEFQANSLRALGMDSNQNAYVYDPSIRSLFRVLEGSGESVEDSAHGSTSTDYTQLALQLKGAAWDLSQLRQGGGVAKSFTNAFIQVKVLEIQSQLSQCMNCTCGADGPTCSILPNANFSSCLRIPVSPGPGETPLQAVIEGPDEVTIVSSRNKSFTCRVNTTAVIRWTLNGGNLPDNVQTSGIGGYKSVLTIISATQRNGGVYTCLVHSQSSVFRSSASVDAIFYDPDQDLMLMVTPLQPVVTRGNNVTISCSVQSSSSFRWLFDDGPLPQNAVITRTSTHSELMLVSVEERNVGAYTCVATSTRRYVVNEDTTYVEVVDPVLRLSVDPDLVAVDKGMMAELICRVDCFCQNVTPSWTRPGSAPFPNQAMVISSGDNVIQLGANIETRLLIPEASLRDSGRYLCSAQLDDVMVTQEAYLTVIGEEDFIPVILGPAQMNVTLGSTHSLVCQTNQNASSISWRFNGKAVREQGSDPADPTEEFAPDNVVSTGQISNVQSVLAIIKANPLNAGLYQCEAISERDTDSEVITGSAIDILVI